ncbi:hypothetical protein Barb7_03168 [Bacteroidales bacterium Barb7]|nr:hypothetical protein Barb7_03168 [Bacteroidales bacterium Barb7]
MFLPHNHLIHPYGDHIYKRTLTLNSLVQLTNIYCLTHYCFFRS